MRQSRFASSARAPRRLLRSPFLGTALLLLIALAAPGGADDVLVTAPLLTITDKTPSGGSAKLKFVVRDSYAGINKRAGTDPSLISARFEMKWTTVDGGFTIPAGALVDGGSAGWSRNDGRTAKYANKDAETGTPTGVRSLVVNHGKSMKLVARTVGDEAINLVTAPIPVFGIQVMLTITNGAEVIRHCTGFPYAGIEIRELRGGGRQLIAKKGVAHECASEPMTVAPIPSLPPTPLAPWLWFDGSDPGAVADLIDRTTAPETAALFASIRGSVDGSLAGLASAGDDTRARVAKGAGLLHVVGETPPGSSGYASYRDVVVAALTGIGPRTATDTIDEFVTPPPDVLVVLQDVGRLQSMAEAYDLIRGSGVALLDDEAMRARIANWADEYMLDWNLVGDPFGFFDGHRDNWAIKSGSALITAALAMPDHANASAWLAQGTTWIDESLAAKVLDPGWYAESAHYLNYSLNNLVPAAWHLRYAAGVDWFDDLEPLVAMAFALRQPDGQQPPFEEGVSNTFPWDVLAAAYPSRMETMQWALESGSGDFGPFDNQQFHEVSRFFVIPLGVVAVEPSDPPTQFIDRETHATILRSAWTDDALQVTSLTALDTSSEESVSSRHHTENPLDVILHGAGALLLPTASGGPQVTTSANRSYYLLPTSKNIPLVDGNAPYVLGPLTVTQSNQIDSRDAADVVHRLFDAATTAVASFAPGVDVARTVAMVGDSYAVVVDRFTSPAAHSYGATWRGRGDGTIRVSTASHIGADYGWPTSGAPSAHLAVDTVGSSALSGGLVTGSYAPSYGVEEDLDPLRVSATAADFTLLSVLGPRLEGSAAAVFAPLALVGGAAASITDGTTVDVLIAGPEGVTRSVSGVEADGRLAVVRSIAGTPAGLAGLRATRVSFAGAAIEAADPITFAATFSTGAVVVTVGEGAVGPFELTLRSLPGLNPGASTGAVFDGTPLPAESVEIQGGAVTVTVPGPGTLLVSDG